MEVYNIVTNGKIISEIKKSKYFITDLGMSVTINNSKGGDRVLNDKDEFAMSYNGYYKTTIYCQGKVGGMRFYIDHFIKDDVIAFYLNLEEFLYEFDFKYASENGIDSYLGRILKKVDEEYLKRTNKVEKIEEPVQRKGNADKILNNPGQIKYEDLKAYLELKNKQGI